MAGLSCRMNNCVWLYFFEKIENALAIADIEFMMMKVLDLAGKAMLVPASISLGAEEGGALIVINAMNLPSTVCEV